MNPTHSEVMEITSAMDDALSITHEQAMELARFGELQDVRNRMRDCVSPPDVHYTLKRYGPPQSDIKLRGILIGCALSMILYGIIYGVWWLVTR